MGRFYKHIWMTLLVILLSAFCTNVEAKDKVVERGMDKTEVRDILGKPKATSFDQYGETWTYWIIPWVGENDKIITVNFDLNDKVISYSERFKDDPSNIDTPPTPTPHASLKPYMLYELGDQEFDFLLSKVRSASFENDKYTLLEVASLGCCYSCNQCARMMELFNFNDDKLKVLKIMAPHIVDAQNAYIIYKTFTFDSDKEKAAQIMTER